MQNAFKKVFGIHVKHRAQGPKGTGGVIQGRKLSTNKAKKNKKDKEIEVEPLKVSIADRIKK